MAIAQGHAHAARRRPPRVRATASRRSTRCCEWPARSSRGALSEGCQSNGAGGPHAIVRPRARRQILSMAPSQRPIGRPRSNAMLLAGLLVCTLVLATLLAYEAHDAARSHRATAERALHDYAAVAAWELVAGVNDELQSSLAGALAPVTRARASSPYELLPAPAVLPRAPRTRCVARRRPVTPRASTFASTFATERSRPPAQRRRRPCARGSPIQSRRMGEASTNRTGTTRSSSADRRSKSVARLPTP